MKGLWNKIRTHKRGILLFGIWAISFVALMATLVGTIFAAPPTSPYNPGDELNPTCAPGDPSCTVNPPIVNIFGVTTSSIRLATSTSYSGGFNISTSSNTLTFNFPGRINDLNNLATTTGNLIVASGTTWFAKAVGSDNYCLTASSTAPGGVAYAPCSSASISSLNGLTGNSQTFATSGTGLIISSSGTVHNFLLSTSSINGLVTNGVSLTFATSGLFGLSISTSSNTLTFTQATSTASQSGFLSSADWTTFNAKQGSITIATSGLTGLSVTSSSNTWTFTLATSTASQSGFLSSADWTTFTNKITTSTAVTTGYFPYWGTAGALTGTSSIYQSGILVGIGTTTPSSLLHLVGGAPVLSLTNSSSTGKTFQLRNGGVATTTFDIYDFSSTTSRLSIDTNGLIAVGTSTIPSDARFSVGSSTANSLFQVTDSGILKIPNAGSQSAPALAFQDHANGGYALGFYETSGAVAIATQGSGGPGISHKFGVQGAAGAYLNIYGGGSLGASNYVSLFSENTSRVLSIGSIFGEGTTNNSLRIYNTYTSANSYERLGLNWTSNAAYIQTEYGGGGGSVRSLNFGVASTTQFTIDTSKNIVIGTSTVPTSAFFAITTSTVATATSTYFSITPAGLVGIGTSTPISLLAMVGGAPVLSLTNSSSTGKTFQLRNGGVATTTFDIYDFSSSTSRFTINTNGLIAIGTSTSPSGVRFSVGSSTANTLFNITDKGLVGIGTSTPLYGLVVGDRSTQLDISVPKGAICVDDATGTGCPASPTAGVVYASSTSITGIDFAENYPTSNDSIEPGDLVVTAAINETDSSTSTDKLGLIEKSSNVYQKNLLGIISTQPGILLGQRVKNAKPVALSGRVPVKVSLENGPIKAGDYLTASSKPGIAMKATEPGMAVGMALEDLNDSNKANKLYVSASSGQGDIYKIVTFVHVGFALGSLEQEEDLYKTSKSYDLFWANENDSMISQFAKAVQWGLNQLGIALDHGVAKLKEIFVNRVTTKELCVGDTCVNEDQLKALINNTPGAVSSGSLLPPSTEPPTPAPTSTEPAASSTDAIVPVPPITPSSTSTDGIVITSTDSVDNGSGSIENDTIITP